MKYMIFIFLVLISCTKNQTTENEKYKLNSILLDNNWVELTDTVNLDLRCIDAGLYEKGAILDSENDYKILFDSSDFSKTLPKNWQWGYCNQYITTGFDFSNRLLLVLLLKQVLVNFTGIFL